MERLLDLQKLVIEEVVEAVSFAISWGSCDNHSCDHGQLPDHGSK